MCTISLEFYSFQPIVSSKIQASINKKSADSIIPGASCHIIMRCGACCVFIANNLDSEWKKKFIFLLVRKKREKRKNNMKFKCLPYSIWEKTKANKFFGNFDIYVANILNRKVAKQREMAGARKRMTLKIMIFKLWDGDDV